MNDDDSSVDVDGDSAGITIMIWATIERGEKWKFGRVEIWKIGFSENTNLEKGKFGEMQIWKNANSEKCKFGNMQIWKSANLKNANLKKCIFGRMQSLKTRKNGHREKMKLDISKKWHLGKMDIGKK